jgi:hypothetical protein
MDSKSVGIIVLAIICVSLFGYVMFNTGFEKGTSFIPSHDYEADCLSKYGMSCEQARDKEIAMP